MILNSITHLIFALRTRCRVPLIILAAVAVTSVVGIANAQQEPAPLVNENARDLIPDRYMVVFKEGVDPETVAAAQEVVKKNGGTVGYTSQLEPRWLDVTIAAQALEELRTVPGVDYIQASQRGTVNSEQLNPPDGLDRTSERLLPLDSRFTFNETGMGALVYVVDTGVLHTHDEFGGRVSVGMRFQDNGMGTILTSNDSVDCNGHGTHVAGTIGSAAYGIAKNVNMYPIRVSVGCTKGVLEPVLIRSLDWLVMNRTPPAVINLSVTFPDPSPMLVTRVQAAISAGFTVVMAAGNDGDNACNYSPNNMPADTIVVGATVTNIDERWVDSNFGPCVTLFAPGSGIRSALSASNSANGSDSGTSMATAHVSGVAAFYLQNPYLPGGGTTASDVWDAIHYANSHSMTPVWGATGIVNAGAGSPRELLHWGSLNHGYTDGDPHIKTVNGISYDFQGAGEYIALRDANSLEIQTRQTAIPTTSTIMNTHTGLATCVSVNTAVATRMGKYRVTYQPNLSGLPDPSGLQLRLDGTLVQPGPAGVDLGPDGRITTTAAGGIQFDFRHNTSLNVTPGWWASKGLWYLNIDVHRTRADAGLMGTVPPGSWLPALPDGTSSGPKPATLQQRFNELYSIFGEAWRVTDKNSLFDYAPEKSTATFTNRNWPPKKPPCNIPDQESSTPVTSQIAESVCQGIADEDRRANCVFDVRVTGHTGFAETYLLSERMQVGSTRTTLFGNRQTKVEEGATFTVVVTPSSVANTRVPSGDVRIVLEGSSIAETLKLDARGRATWTNSHLPVGNHRLIAHYAPDSQSAFLPSASSSLIHIVTQ